MVIRHNVLSGRWEKYKSPCSENYDHSARVLVGGPAGARNRTPPASSSITQPQAARNSNFFFFGVVPPSLIWYTEGEPNDAASSGLTDRGIMISTKREYTCDREDWTGEPCNWTGTDPGRAAGAVIYCPKCEWMIEVNYDRHWRLVH